MHYVQYPERLRTQALNPRSGDEGEGEARW